MVITIRLIVLLMAALATGGLMVNWIGLGRAMARLSSAAVYTEFHQATNQTFDPYMPIVVVGALLGGIALAALSPGIHSASGQLAILSIFCYATVPGNRSAHMRANQPAHCPLADSVPPR